MLPFFPDLTLAASCHKSIFSTIVSDTTTNGTAIDCKDMEGTLHVYVTTGNAGDGSTVIEVQLEQSDVSGSGFADITGATKTYAASATANDDLAEFAFKVDNRSKRYVRAVVITSGGGSVSVPIAVSIVGRKKIAGGSGIKTTN